MKIKSVDFSAVQHPKESHSSDTQMDGRQELLRLFNSSPLPPEELMSSLAMYMRASSLVKILVLEDLYRRILSIPGCILEFGTRWGQNLVLFENLRAILEPFNKTRKIVGFDTFQGYQGHTGLDRSSDVFTEKSYQTSENYPDYLNELLLAHEGANILGHVSNGHQIVQGDVCTTVAQYFDNHQETIVALAYFDMGLFRPTKAALEAIKPHLVAGSVILMDELTWQESPGEALAFKECFHRDEYLIEKSVLTPMRSIITVK